MIIGPKYKIARRLGAPVFEKTQTQKYALRAEKKLKNNPLKPKSEYGNQYNEKQKVRMFYGVSEKQFSNYVKKSISKKASQAVSSIFETLELRLDNLVSKIGFAKTHRGARQMVSHGHILLNGKRNNIPSTQLKIGDQISIREGSKSGKLTSEIDERFKNITIPDWISYDNSKKTAVITARPKMEGGLMFDLNSVVEFYSR